MYPESQGQLFYLRIRNEFDSYKDTVIVRDLPVLLRKKSNHINQVVRRSPRSDLSVPLMFATFHRDRNLSNVKSFPLSIHSCISVISLYTRYYLYKYSTSSSIIPRN